MSIVVSLLYLFLPVWSDLLKGGKKRVTYAAGYGSCCSDEEASGRDMDSKNSKQLARHPLTKALEFVKYGLTNVTEAWSSRTATGGVCVVDTSWKEVVALRLRLPYFLLYNAHPCIMRICKIETQFFNLCLSRL